MVRTVLGGAAGFVVGFLVLIFGGVAGFNLVGSRMLEAAGWSPGLDVPTHYVWWTLTVRFLAAVLAGAAIGLIARSAAPLAVGALIVVSGARGIIEFIGTLDSNPQWYTLGLAFVLLPALPIGVVVGKRLRSLVVKQSPDAQ